MVHTDFQLSFNINCISQHRYFSRMAWDLQASCSFLYWVLSCQLPEDIIDAELTVRTMKGIHAYWRDCSTQASLCSPWSAWVKPFPSLVRKMENYLEERRNIENPFNPSCIYPNGPTVSPLPRRRRPKPPQKSSTKNNRGNRRQGKVRRLEGCFPPLKAPMPLFMLASLPATKTTPTTTAAMVLAFELFPTCQPQKPWQPLNTARFPK